MRGVRVTLLRSDGGVDQMHRYRDEEKNGANKKRYDMEYEKN
jgi:hypothetical protein